MIYSKKRAIARRMREQALTDGISGTMASAVCLLQMGMSRGIDDSTGTLLHIRGTDAEVFYSDDSTVPFNNSGLEQRDPQLAFLFA